jgi:hypothetical protein
VELTELDRRIAQDLWKRKMRPDDGILLGAGAFVSLRLREDSRTNQLEPIFGNLQSISHAMGVKEWNDSDVPESLGHLCENGKRDPTPELNKCVWFGEGSWGGDGFVALVDAATGYLIWLLCSSEANPFDSVRVVGNKLIEAHSTLNKTWRIPIDSPLLLSIGGC